MNLYYHSEALIKYAKAITAIVPDIHVELLQLSPNPNEMRVIFQDKFPQDKLWLYLTIDGLIVYSSQFKPFNCKDFYHDFILRRKKSLNRELLLQAINLKSNQTQSLSCLDLTAGLGRDALLMGLAGFKVTMLENNPYLAIILRYLCLEFADLVSDLQVVYSNNYDYLLKSCDKYDVVYLDPMFNDTKSALAKKDMQLIDLFIELFKLELNSQVSQIEAEVAEILPNEQASWEQLFKVAKNCCSQKFLIKRDNKQQRLFMNPLPTYTKSGKTIRFDVYQCN